MSRQCALDYLARGWRPIPITPRSKRPSSDRWPMYRATPDSIESDWTPRSGTGVVLGEPSGWLVDVDLDIPQAVDLAPHFLPPTLVFGRDSNPNSHWLFVCQGAKTEKFQHEKMVLELRSTGCQTVFPGTVHEGGEMIAWSTDVEPTVIDWSDLRQRCAELACAALLALHGMTLS